MDPAEYREGFLHIQKAGSNIQAIECAQRGYLFNCIDAQYARSYMKLTIITDKDINNIGLPGRPTRLKLTVLANTNTGINNILGTHLKLTVLANKNINNIPGTCTCLRVTIITDRSIPG